VGAEKSASVDGDEADGENALNTTKSVKRPPKTTADLSGTTGDDATVDKTDTPGSDSGSSASTGSAASTSSTVDAK
jgi:hypothetical protein